MTCKQDGSDSLCIKELAYTGSSPIKADSSWDCRATTDGLETLRPTTCDRNENNNQRYCNPVPADQVLQNLKTQLIEMAKNTSDDTGLCHSYARMSADCWRLVYNNQSDPDHYAKLSLISKYIVAK